MVNDEASAEPFSADILRIYESIVRSSGHFCASYYLSLEAGKIFLFQQEVTLLLEERLTMGGMSHLRGHLSSLLADGKETALYFPFMGSGSSFEVLGGRRTFEQKARHCLHKTII